MAVGVKSQIVLVHVDILHIVATVELIGDIVVNVSQLFLGFAHSEENVHSLHRPRRTKPSDLVNINGLEPRKLALARARNRGLLLSKEAIQ